MAERNTEGFNPTRRSVLKRIGSAGFIVPATGQIVAGSSEGEVEITVVASADGPVVTKTVPADWWEHEQRAESVKKQVERRLGTRTIGGPTPGVTGVGLGKEDRTISGKYVSYVRITVNPDNRPGLDLPSMIDGVAIRVEEEPEGRPLDCHQQRYTPVPGGVGMATVDFDEYYEGTTTCKVKVDSSPHMLTAAHLWDLGDDCSNSLKGKKAYQDQNQMGEITAWDNGEDWAVIDKTGNETSGYESGIEGLFAKQNGYVTKDGLKDLKGNATTVYQMGISTCQTSGTVEEVDVSKNPKYCFDSDHAVGVDIYVENGDSGGPIYHKFTFNNDKYVSIIAPSWGETDYLYGTAAFHLHNTHGMTFDFT